MTTPESESVVLFPGGTPDQAMPLTEYLEHLTVIQARTPTDESLITVSVEPMLIQRLAGAKMTDKLFDFSYVICGIPPQVNNIGYHERGSDAADLPQGLTQPRSIYQGIQRPMIDEGIDGAVFVYVLRTGHRYRYTPHMVCCAKKVVVPKNTAFVAYVRFDEDNFNNGKIVGWDWVKCDPQHPDLPKDFNNRYDSEVYSNG